MAYGMFYKQIEITKKNGRLPSVEDAIKQAEERFWDGDAPNPCQCFHDLDEAREALAKEKCELLPSQYYAVALDIAPTCTASWKSAAATAMASQNGHTHMTTRRVRQ